MPSVKRGCGLRVAAGIYIEVLLSTNGAPLEAFLKDPPVPVPPGLVIPTIGQKLIERPGRPGIWDLWDHVGSNNYPDVWGFVEEVRAHGVSRRLSANTEFHKLGPQSMLILLHERAILSDPKAYYAAIERDMKAGRITGKWSCVCGRTEHMKLPDLKKSGTMCASLWLHDLSPQATDKDADRRVRERIGDTEFNAWVRPHGVNAGAQRGIFAAFPLTRIAVVKDIENGAHHQKAELAGKSRLPVAIVKE